MRAVRRREALTLISAGLGMGLLAACAGPSTPPSPTSSGTTQPATAAPAAAKAGTEAPRYGGELVYSVNSDPPSFDGHQESTWAVIYPVGPQYNLLIRLSQNEYPKIEGDLAETWSISPDGLLYEFKVRDGVTFHDGARLTARDVKASFEHFINPPQGVLSPRRALYTPVDSIEAPDDHTVRFKLKYPSSSLLPNLASPYNFIYKADRLAQDPNWYKTNVEGTGPFKFVEYVPGSHWLAKKNEAYFLKGRPYLDGYRAVFIKDDQARVAAIRGGRSMIDYRAFSPTARDDLVRALGDQVVVQESPLLSNEYMYFNTRRKPFDDPRVRRGLSMALDHWGAAPAIAQFSYFKYVGLTMRPGSEWAFTDAELESVPGFGRDADRMRQQARQLLQEAGLPANFTFTLTNRDVEPFPTAGLFAIDQWHRIGIDVTHQIQDLGPYTQAGRSGNFDVFMGATGDFYDDPDQQLARWLSTDQNPGNYAGYTDPLLDDLFQRQSRETDTQKRKLMVHDFERRVFDEMAYGAVAFWQNRIVVHSARVKGWKITPSYYVLDLNDVWLAD